MGFSPSDLTTVPNSAAEISPDESRSNMSNARRSISSLHPEESSVAAPLPEGAGEEALLPLT